MKKWFKTSKEAHTRRDELNSLGADVKVYKVRNRFLVGTYADWLLAVS